MPFNPANPDRTERESRRGRRHGLTYREERPPDPRDILAHSSFLTESPQVATTGVPQASMTGSRGLFLPEDDFDLQVLQMELSLYMNRAVVVEPGLKGFKRGYVIRDVDGLPSAHLVWLEQISRRYRSEIEPLRRAGLGLVPYRDSQTYQVEGPRRQLLRNNSYTSSLGSSRTLLQEDFLSDNSSYVSGQGYNLGLQPPAMQPQQTWAGYASEQVEYERRAQTNLGIYSQPVSGNYPPLERTDVPGTQAGYNSQSLLGGQLYSGSGYFGQHASYPSYPSSYVGETGPNEYGPYVPPPKDDPQRKKDQDDRGDREREKRRKKREKDGKEEAERRKDPKGGEDPRRGGDSRSSYGQDRMPRPRRPRSPNKGDPPQEWNRPPQG